MGKIGIITFHRTTNFGSLLQTYGLYKKIELLGETPEIIDYRCDEIESREELNNQIKFTVRELAKRVLFYPTIKRKAEKLYAFLEKNTQMSNPVYADNIQQLSYDKIIVGSDIVWGRDITNHDYNYFLEFCDEDEKKYAFSSSVGDYTVYDDDEYIGKLLKHFNKIAVREEEAQNWVRKLADKEADLVCDPTMLLTIDEWEQVVRPVKYTEEYVLVYFDSPGSKCLQDAINYAEKKKLKVFYINYGLHAKNTKTVKPTSLEEFLGLVKHATTVFTASYHGMLFSLYYNKQFYFYTRAHSSRVISLAKILGVEERLGDSGIVDTDIDYSIVNEKINHFRNKSIEILGEMLDEQ